jgi:hypothetical protein
MPNPLNRAVDMAGDAVRKIIAYHGSPHNFDRFDASKIDTGEGVQAFGHGLYFAGNESTGQYYRDTLGGQKIVDYLDGNPLDRSEYAKYATGEVAYPSIDTEQGVLARLLSTPGFPIQGSSSLLDRQIKRIETPSRRHSNSLALRLMGTPWESASVDELKAARDIAANLESRTSSVRSPAGVMYQVEIGHPESSLLDWDAPMSQQPLPVRRAFGDSGMDLPGDGRRVYMDAVTRLGEGFDDDATGFLAGKAAAEELLSEGIPGIKYLDGMSRNLGAGSRNYVMFPGTEDSITILRKYGLLPAVGVGAASAGSAMQNPAQDSQ